MRDIVYVLVFDGCADHEVALALTEVRRPGSYRVHAVAAGQGVVTTGSGLCVQAELRPEQMDLARAALLVIPGGDLWQRGDGDELVRLLPRILASGVALAGIGAGTLALTRAGLLDRRRHTGNRPGYIDGFVPAYAGAEQYDSTVLAVSDDGVTTASALGGVEFAREVIRTLDLYDPTETGHWFRMFKHAVPPPSLADLATI